MKRQYDHDNQIIKKQKREDSVINELSIMREKIDKLETMMIQLINMIKSNNIHDIPLPFRNICSYIG